MTQDIQTTTATFAAVKGAANPLPWRYLAASEHQVVYLNAAGEQVSTLTYGVDFTIVPDADTPANTGILTIITDPPATAVNIRVDAVTPATQNYTATPNAAGVEAQFDRLAMAIQQLRQRQGEIVYDEAALQQFKNSAQQSAASAAAAASQAALYDGPRFDTLAALLADTGMTYALNPVGTLVLVSNTMAFVVVDAAATDQHHTTAGGVKVKVPVGDVQAEQFGFALAGNTSAQNATALQAANDFLAANGGGRLRVMTPATIEGDFYLSSNVRFDGAGTRLTFNNGGFRIDGAHNGAHVEHWHAKIEVERTGTAGPAIYLGGDDTAAPNNKAAIRGVLEPIVYASTGVGIELSNTFMVDIITPNIRNCAAEGWKFHYGPQGLTAANAINIFGGETQQCAKGYTTQGVSGIYWHGHVIQGNGAECFIGENSRDIHHYGGYTELNGTTGYDFIIGDAASSPANINFDGMIFNDGAGASKTHAIKAVKCNGLSIRDCRGSGYGTALIDFQPTGGGAVRGEWQNITGVAATDAADNVYFRSAIFADYVIKHTFTWDIPSLPAQGATTHTETVTGAKTGDFVQVSYSGGNDEIVITAQVTAADTVKLRAVNTGSVTRDPGNATYRLLVTQQGFLV